MDSKAQNDPITHSAKGELECNIVLESVCQETPACGEHLQQKDHFPETPRPS